MKILYIVLPIFLFISCENADKYNIGDKISEYEISINNTIEFAKTNKAFLKHLDTTRVWKLSTNDSVRYVKFKKDLDSIGNDIRIKRDEVEAYYQLMSFEQKTKIKGLDYLFNKKSSKLSNHTNRF